MVYSVHTHGGRLDCVHNVSLQMYVKHFLPENSHTQHTHAHIQCTHTHARTRTHTHNTHVHIHIHTMTLNTANKGMGTC